MFKNLTLGGQTRNREPALNELSWLCLQATENMRLSSPSVSVRYWKGMSDDFLLRCLQTIRAHGGGQPALFNDEAVIASQVAVGIPPEEACDYAIDGCVEPCQPGKGMKNGGLFSCMNLLKILE
jgi:formate C-acetyltransferase